MLWGSSLASQANEEVGRSLYELLRRQFGGLSLSPFVEGEDMVHTPLPSGVVLPWVAQLMPLLT